MPVPLLSCNVCGNTLGELIDGEAVMRPRVRGSTGSASRLSAYQHPARERGSGRRVGYGMRRIDCERCGEGFWERPAGTARTS